MLPGAAPIRVALAVTLPQEHLRQSASRGEGREGRGAANTHVFADRQFAPLPVGHPLCLPHVRSGPLGGFCCCFNTSTSKCSPHSVTASLTHSVAPLHARCFIRPQLLRPSPLLRRCLIKRKRFCRLPTQISPRYRLAYNNAPQSSDDETTVRSSSWYMFFFFSRGPVLKIFF